MADDKSVWDEECDGKARHYYRSPGVESRKHSGAQRQIFNAKNRPCGLIYYNGKNFKEILRDDIINKVKSSSKTSVTKKQVPILTQECRPKSSYLGVYGQTSGAAVSSRVTSAIESVLASNSFLQGKASGKQWQRSLTSKTDILSHSRKLSQKFSKNNFSARKSLAEESARELRRDMVRGGVRPLDVLAKNSERASIVSAPGGWKSMQWKSELEKEVHTRKHPGYVNTGSHKFPSSFYNCRAQTPKTLPVQPGNKIMKKAINSTDIKEKWGLTRDPWPTYHPFKPVVSTEQHKKNYPKVDSKLLNNCKCKVCDQYFCFDKSHIECDLNEFFCVYKNKQKLEEGGKCIETNEEQRKNSETSSKCDIHLVEVDEQDKNMAEEIVQDSPEFVANLQKKEIAVRHVTLNKDPPSQSGSHLPLDGDLPYKDDTKNVSGSDRTINSIIKVELKKYDLTVDCLDYPRTTSHYVDIEKQQPVEEENSGNTLHRSSNSKKSLKISYRSDSKSQNDKIDSEEAHTKNLRKLTPSESKNLCISKTSGTAVNLKSRSNKKDPYKLVHSLDNFTQIKSYVDLNDGPNKMNCKVKENRKDGRKTSRPVSDIISQDVELLTPYNNLHDVINSVHDLKAEDYFTTDQANKNILKCDQNEAIPGTLKKNGVSESQEKPTSNRHQLSIAHKEKSIYKDKTGSQYSRPQDPQKVDTKKYPCLNIRQIAFGTDVDDGCEYKSPLVDKSIGNLNVSNNMAGYEENNTQDYTIRGANDNQLGMFSYDNDSLQEAFSCDNKAFQHSYMKYTNCKKTHDSVGVFLLTSTVDNVYKNPLCQMRAVSDDGVNPTVSPTRYRGFLPSLKDKPVQRQSVQYLKQFQDDKIYYQEEIQQNRTDMDIDKYEITDVNESLKLKMYKKESKRKVPLSKGIEKCEENFCSSNANITASLEVEQDRRYHVYEKIAQSRSNSNAYNSNNKQKTAANKQKRGEYNYDSVFQSSKHDKKVLEKIKKKNYAEYLRRKIPGWEMVYDYITDKFIVRQMTEGTKLFSECPFKIAPYLNSDKRHIKVFDSTSMEDTMLDDSESELSQTCDQIEDYYKKYPQSKLKKLTSFYNNNRPSEEYKPGYSFRIHSSFPIPRLDEYANYVVSNNEKEKFSLQCQSDPLQLGEARYFDAPEKRVISSIEDLKTWNRIHENLNRHPQKLPGKNYSHSYVNFYWTNISDRRRRARSFLTVPPLQRFCAPSCGKRIYFPWSKTAQEADNFVNSCVRKAPLKVKHLTFSEKFQAGQKTLQYIPKAMNMPAVSVSGKCKGKENIAKVSNLINSTRPLLRRPLLPRTVSVQDKTEHVILDHNNDPDHDQASKPIIDEASRTEVAFRRNKWRKRGERFLKPKDEMADMNDEDQGFYQDIKNGSKEFVENINRELAFDMSWFDEAKRVFSDDDLTDSEAPSSRSSSSLNSNSPTISVCMTLSSRSSSMLSAGEVTMLSAGEVMLSAGEVTLKSQVKGVIKTNSDEETADEKTPDYY